MAERDSPPPPRAPRALVLGLTGAPGSGKSTVAGMLARLGARTLDADGLVHRALRDAGVARRLEAALGPGVRGRRGGIDRAAVAARVFRDPAALRRLTALVHPIVLRRLREEVARARRRRRGVLVLEAALLFESGLDRDCDAAVVVEAPRRVRLARLRGRGWRAADLRAREGFLMDAAGRRRRADRVVRNGDGLAATRAQVRRLWAELVEGGRP